MEPRKFCPGCKQTKHITQWQRNSHTSDGLQTRCAECQTESVRKSRAKRAKAVAWADKQLRKEQAERHAELVSAFMERAK